MRCGGAPDGAAGRMMAGAGGRLGVNVLKSGGIVNRVIVNGSVSF